MVDRLFKLHLLHSLPNVMRQEGREHQSFINEIRLLLSCKSLHDRHKNMICYVFFFSSSSSMLKHINRNLTIKCVVNEII